MSSGFKQMLLLRAGDSRQESVVRRQETVVGIRNLARRLPRPGESGRAMTRWVTASVKNRGKTRKLKLFLCFLYQSLRYESR
jgi:hypothetical protein